MIHNAKCPLEIKSRGKEREREREKISRFVSGCGPFESSRGIKIVVEDSTVTSVS